VTSTLPRRDEHRAVPGVAHEVDVDTNSETVVATGQTETSIPFRDRGRRDTVRAWLRRRQLEDDPDGHSISSSATRSTATACSTSRSGRGHGGRQHYFVEGTYDCSRSVGPHSSKRTTRPQKINRSFTADITFTEGRWITNAATLWAAALERGEFESQGSTLTLDSGDIATTASGRDHEPPSRSRGMTDRHLQHSCLRRQLQDERHHAWRA